MTIQAATNCSSCFILMIDYERGRAALRAAAMRSTFLITVIDADNQNNWARVRVHVTPAASIEMISGPREAEVLSTLTLKIGAKDASGRPLLSCANLSLEWTSNEEVCDASGQNR